jgi:taurine--2-oxoglutarate transaminase
VVDEVGDRAAANGTYLATMINTLIVAPPLSITRDEVDEAVSHIDDALTVADRAMVD